MMKTVLKGGRLEEIHFEITSDDPKDIQVYIDEEHSTPVCSIRVLDWKRDVQASDTDPFPIYTGCTFKPFLDATPLKFLLERQFELTLLPDKKFYIILKNEPKEMPLKVALCTLTEVSGTKSDLLFTFDASIIEPK